MYNDLKLEFRRDLNLPINATNMNAFLIEMKNKKKIWWALSVKHRESANIASIDNQRSSEIFNRSSNAYRFIDQDQYEEYRDDDDDYKTSHDSFNLSSRNQFSTFYQFRNQSLYQYQNRAY